MKIYVYNLSPNRYHVVVSSSEEAAGKLLAAPVIESHKKMVEYHRSMSRPEYTEIYERDLRYLESGEFMENVLSYDIVDGLEILL